VAGLENKIKKEVLHGGNGDTADTAGLLLLITSMFAEGDPLRRCDFIGGVGGC